MADLNKNNKGTELDDRELSEVSGGLRLEKNSGLNEALNLNSSIRRVRRYNEDEADVDIDVENRIRRPRPKKIL